MNAMTYQKSSAITDTKNFDTTTSAMIIMALFKLKINNLIKSKTNVSQM